MATIDSLTVKATPLGTDKIELNDGKSAALSTLPVSVPQAAADAVVLASAATDATTKANAVTAASCQRASNLADLASASTARTNLGLGNVDNTSDAAKPVSTATQTALDLKLNASEKGASGGVALNDLSSDESQAALDARLDGLVISAAEKQGWRLQATAEAALAEPTVGTTVGAMQVQQSASSASYGAVTLTDAGNLITTSAAHGLAVNDPVVLGTITTTTGITAGNIYYVRTTPSSTTFTVSSTPGGSEHNFTTDGSAANLWRRYAAWYRPTEVKQPKFRVLGSRVAKANINTPRFDYAVTDPTIMTYSPGTVVGPGPIWEFELTGTSVDVLFRNGGSQRARIFVDDRLSKTVTGTDFSGASVAGGALGRIPLTFSDARRRLIRVELPTAADEWPGIEVGASTVVDYPVSTPPGPFVMLQGDSFVEGTGSSAGDRGLAEWVGVFLGWQNLWRCGSGSTGYIADGTRVALEDRYANDIIAQNPNIVIIALGINDMTLYASDPVNFRTKVATIWDAVIAHSTVYELIIIGPWPNSGGVGVVQDLINMDADLRELAVARGLRYISPIGEGWTFTLFDSVHPNSAGHKKLGRLIAGHLATPAKTFSAT